MADEKLTALTATTTPASTDIIYVVVDPGTTPVSKKVALANTANAIDAATWAVIQASQLTNEIKGWPPCVKPDADLVTLNLWWDDVATPTTKATVVDVAGEAGITETFELALKCVGDGAGDGLQQIWTYADEPRLKSGRVMSAMLAIWSVGGISITAKLVNSDASQTAASAVTAAAWTIVKIENHTLAGTTVSLQVTAGAAGTFYVVPLGANIGAKAVPLGPRPERYIDEGSPLVVNNGDSGGAFTDCDVTASTSPLATRVKLTYSFQVNAAGKDLSVRRNGSTVIYGTDSSIGYTVAANTYYHGAGECNVDDGQIFEWQASDVGANTENVYILLRGWWEWA